MQLVILYFVDDKNRPIGCPYYLVLSDGNGVQTSLAYLTVDKKICPSYGAYSESFLRGV